MTKQKKTEKEELSFTFEQVMNEMDKYREKRYVSGVDYLTPEQIRFIKTARENARPVSYSIMTTLWIKTGWGKVSSATLANYHHTLKTRGWKV
jgi:hypothetical protein